MSLKETITTDMKTAMKAGDSAKLLTIRMLLAAVKQREVDERIVLTDTDVVAFRRTHGRAARLGGRFFRWRV